MRFILRNILFLLNLIFVLGLLLSYLAPYVDPKDFWPIAFFGLTFKAWLLLNFLLIVLWISLSRKLWLYNSIAIILGAQYAFQEIQLHDQKPENANLSVMVFNTRVQQVYDGSNTSGLINQYLLNEKIDIAILVEWLDKQGHIDEGEFPFQQMVAINTSRDRHRYGMKLISRHKILNWARLEFPHYSNNVTAYFDLEIGEQIIRFVGTHLQSNSLVASDYQKFINLDFDKEYKEHARDVISKMRSALVRRAVQVDVIEELIDNSPYPVIVLGDFNDTPQSYAYQKLKGKRKDAYITNGRGWGSTYLKPFPLLRIDFILYDPLITCMAFKTDDIIESDHKLLIAHFKL